MINNVIKKANVQRSYYPLSSMLNKPDQEGALCLDHSNYSAFDLGDHLMLVRCGVDRFFLLNETAQLIWKKIFQGQTIDKIRYEVAEHYDIPMDVVQQDLEQTLQQWFDEGLVGDIEPQNNKVLKPRNRITERPVPIAQKRSHKRYSEKHYFITGTRIKIRFDLEEQIKAVHPLLSHFNLKAGLSEQNIFELRNKSDITELIQDGQVLMSTKNLDAAIIRLIREIISCVCQNLDTLMLLHAGGVARDNHSILFPAASGSGKSTLTAALLQEDYIYLSDDIVPVDRVTGHALPLPFSLNLKPHGLSVLEPLLGQLDTLRHYHVDSYRVAYFPPPECKSNGLLTSYPVAGLVFPCYSNNQETCITRLTPAIALQRLMDTNSVLPRSGDTARIDILTNWLNQTPAFEFTYNSLDTAIETINNLFKILTEKDALSRQENSHYENEQSQINNKKVFFK